MKEKYINAYLATKNDEAVTTADEIVGYYLVNYGDEALIQWKENLSLSRWQYPTDSDVTRILENVFSK